jgi:two-component system sensor histidine kinase KdpD
VSHELRTPVTTIYGNARLLLDRVDRLPDAERDMVADIAVDSERLLAIVENLLLLSRLQAGAEPDLEPELLRHVVEQEVAAFTKRHPERRVAFAAPGHHVVVDADRAYLMLVVQNLLSNADKYGGSGSIGSSSTTTRSKAASGPGSRAGHRQGRPGGPLLALLPAKAAQKAASGLGLGLPVCRRISRRWAAGSGPTARWRRLRIRVRGPDQPRSRGNEA